MLRPAHANSVLHNRGHRVRENAHIVDDCRREGRPRQSPSTLAATNLRRCHPSLAPRREASPTFNGLRHRFASNPDAAKLWRNVQRFVLRTGPSLGTVRIVSPSLNYVEKVSRPVRTHTPAQKSCYLISVSNLNIGRYMLMITMPTMIPTPSIMIGSTIEVSAWTEASTSSS